MNSRLLEIGQRIQKFFTKDYCIHGLYTFLITTVAGAVLPLWIACILAMAIGLAKEALDQASYGGWSWTDLAGDFVGMMLSLAVLLIIRLLH